MRLAFPRPHVSIAIGACAVIALALIAPARAASHAPEDLAQISARGRALYAYDAAAAAATDAVQARFGKNPPPARFMYIGHVEGGAWIFDFGTLSADNDLFRVQFRARETAPHTLTFEATALTPPQPETAFDLNAGRAVMLAQADFGPVGRPYNYAILQLQNSDLYVYVYPAQTDPKIHPLGGDERYLISADGARILERHRMHRAILDIDMTSHQGVPPGSSVVSGMHTDIFEDVPEDTDVFHVLIRRPQLPDYVSAQNQLYRIDVDGTIVFIKTLGP